MKKQLRFLCRMLATALCTAILPPLLASCGGNGGNEKVTTVGTAAETTAVTTLPITFADSLGKDSITGLTDPYCTNQRLFESGGRINYRIPSLFVLNDGTLIAVIVQRYDTLADDAPEKYVVIRRSTDGGLTWTEDSYLNYLENYNVDYKGGVYDTINDTLIIFLSTAVELPEAKAQQIATSPRPYVGDYIMKSTDGGVTWEFATYTHKANADGIRANIYGNDHGVQISSGPYAGRLVIGARRGAYNYLVYSDDGGKTWVTGAQAQESTGECGVAVLPNGAIYMNSRTYTNTGLRYEGWSFDGGETLVQMATSADLVEPAYGCNSSVLAFPHPKTGKTVMLYSGLNNFVPGVTSSSTNRYNISVWVSYDEGKTWPVCKTIDSDRSAYSSMTYDSEAGLIYILYESGHEVLYDRGANIVTCNLAWLESDEPTPAYIYAQPADSWQAKASNCFAGGTGTTEDPFLVATAEQLALIARLVNYGQTLEGTCFKQIANIDLAGYNWTSIGRASSWNNNRVDTSLPNAPFSGNYDGNGHIIQNLTAKGLQYSGVGLFGYVKNATISNVFINNGYVHSAIRSSGVVGWIAGRGDTTTVTNCFFRGTLAYDVPEVEVEEKGFFDVGYKNGASVPGDITAFSEGTATGNATVLLPEVDVMSWYFLSADAWAGGNGTSQNPYLIETPEQLARLATEVNSGNTLKGQFFRLTANIDLSAHDWEPIGYPYSASANHISTNSNNLSFEGVLDGDGHTVSGMRVVSRKFCAGFFSYLCGGTVRNLAVKGTVTGTDTVGGFVGFLRPNTAEAPTTVENCFFEGEVTSISEDPNNIGGFAGRTHWASGSGSSTPANHPRNGLLKNLYCKTIINGNPESVTNTLFFGGQYRDLGAWTISRCNAVKDLPENAGIALYRSKCNRAIGITTDTFNAAYETFKR